ncbi:MAG: NUDIX hydrolase [Cyclobacteriaceae bacterium]
MHRPLIQENYESQTKMYVAVDCIIFGFDNEELKLLLVKRDFEPEKGKWSLIGGFVGEDETSYDAADRVLKMLTGLDKIYMEQVSAFSRPDRDPVARTISIAYYALIDIETHNKELIRKYSASWFSLKELPALIFDHEEMLAAALTKLRYNTSIKPISFELLPEKFTIRQLQKLYEAILNVKLDKRNFTKKINNMDFLLKLNEKDMNSSKKGSYLYQFDPEKYHRKMKEGIYFKF